MNKQKTVKKKNRSIRVKIILTLSIVFCIAATTLSTTIYFLSSREIEKLDVDNVLITSIEQAHEMTVYFDNASRQAEVIAELDSVKNFLLGKRNSTAPEALLDLQQCKTNGDPYLALYVLDAGGIARISTDASFIDNDYSFRNYYKIALAGKGYVEMVQGITSGQPGYYFSQPIFSNDKEVIGVAVVKMSPDILEQSLSKSSISKKGHFLFVDKDGIVLSADVKERVYKSLGKLSSEKIQELLSARRFKVQTISALSYEQALTYINTYREPINLQFYDEADREDEVLAIVRLGNFPYYLIVERGTEDIAAAAFRIVAPFAIIVVLFASIFMFILYLALSRIISPLKRLKEFSEKISYGKITERLALSSHDEFEDLTQAMNSMADKVQESYRNLERKIVERTSDLEKFRRAVADASDHIVITDADGNIIYANKAVERITGYTPEEILGKKAGSKELWGGQMSKEFYKKLWKTIKIDKKPFGGEIVNKRKSGQLYTALGAISPILDSKGNITNFIGIERDITSEKKRLEESERLATIVNDSGDAIMSRTVDGIIQSWNRGCEILYGYSAREMIGQSFKRLVPPELSDDHEKILEMVRKGKRYANYQTVRIRKDGRQIEVALTLSPLHDTHGEIVGFSSIARDITKEKAIDKAKTEFVSLASHQLRTPLTAINWYVEMLLAGDVGKMTKKQKEYLNEVETGNRRMIELVNALLNVSRIDLGTFEIDPSLVSLSDIARDVIKEMMVTIKQKSIKVKTDFDTRLKKIMADPKLIRIVFQNLLSNAIKYTPDKGTVTISVQQQDKNIAISIKDTGYGIPKNQQEQIFTKLFRADNVRAKSVEGTGLGLYIVKAIVDASEGKIWFESEEDKGTTFFITIPMSGMKKKAGNKSLTQT